MTLPKASQIRRCLPSLIILLGLAWAVPAYWLGAKARLSQWVLEAAWAGTPSTQSRALLDWAFDTQVSGRLVWQEGGKTWYIIDGTQAENLKLAPGWHDQSVRPGEKGRALISAHKDTHFAGLGKVAVGDHLIWSTSPGEQITFTVSRLEIVPAQTNLSVDSSDPELVLSTCYPLAASAPSTERFLIRARLQSG